MVRQFFSAHSAGTRGRPRRNQRNGAGVGWQEPIYVISVAAELADMHPQTLRQYDRMGLVVPQRQGGGQRRYSQENVHRLRRVQELSREGVSLEGIKRIVELESQVDDLQETVSELAEQVELLYSFTRFSRTFTAGAEGDVSTSFETPEQHVGDPKKTAAPGATGSRNPRQRMPPMRSLAAAPPMPKMVLRRLERGK